MKNIFVLGDIHGDWNCIPYWINQYDIKNAYLIQVGDFGIGFPKTEDDSRLKKINTQLKKRNIILYVIRGNHDNPDRFDGNYNIGNIQFIPDYSVLELEKNILAVGGAISIDRTERSNGVSWWPEEKFVFDENKIRVLENIDIVITHASPTFCCPVKWNTLVYNWADRDPGLHKELPKERKLLEDMYNILIKKNKIEKWVYGHYHLSKKEIHFGTEFILLGINEFQEIKI